MRATLVYNAKAGSAPPAEKIIAALGDLGWTVEASLTRSEVKECLRPGTDVVVAAGGDGTVAAVASSLVSTDVPMVIIPTGTANNIARSLGLGVDAQVALSGLARPMERRIDLGVVRGPKFKEYFLEGFGVGIFAFVMGERASRKDKRLKYALSLLADELIDYSPSHYEIMVDGRPMHGHYVLAAAMNGKSFGPAIALAPDAKNDDGELDLVLIRPEGKEALRKHLHRASKEGDLVLPAFETQRVQNVTLRADGQWAHVDDRARELDGEVAIDVIARAVSLLVPAP